MIKRARFTEADAEAHVHGIAFKTGPPQRVGVELEWLVRDPGDPAQPVRAEQVAAALAPFEAGTPASKQGYPEPEQRIVRYQIPALPSGATLTVEPGGQLELSSAPAVTLGELVEVTGQDLAALRDAAAAAGLELCGYGLDPLRPPRRVLDLPRYAAMEKFFDRDGPWGRQMMCGTASVQVCLDAGDDGAGESGYRSRWRLLHAIGPVLVAAFANSPLRDGRPTGWHSARQQVWANMDPGRTRAPAADGDPRDAWAAYALDAELMCVREPASTDWTAPPGLTFRDWVRDGGSGTLRPPTPEDLDYHLSTLFPPVRPRGHMELRMIDAQPGDGWIVPAAVATALVGDERAAEVALAAAEPVWAGNEQGPDPQRSSPADAHDPWLRAAQSGPADPHISRAAKQCFEAADAALGRAGAPAPIRQAVADFTERYVLQDRCPANDQLDGVS
ncbi:MAG TPA: ergothioneine biosynthesis glutamate--cysteine ligase EgtA [Streptosporangiaceae bacterium]|nr:ergothioneine biosynthesis glutamate--cysteine ligase EgtA [Streptosporangiaceae bacterium]